AAPQIPIMQVATPVMRSDGKPYGIVIIDVDMAPALVRVRSSVRQGESAYLVDRKGDYLINPDATMEFGSQRGRPTDWRRDMPYFASLAGATKSLALQLDDDGRSGGAAFAPVALAGSEWVAFIQSVPRAVFMAP